MLVGWWSHVDALELVDILLDARSFYDMESGDPEEPMARITRMLEMIDKGRERPKPYIPPQQTESPDAGSS